MHDRPSPLPIATMTSQVPHGLEPMDRTCHYSVVIPCYRSAASLPELIQRLVAVLEKRGKAFEIVLINDASPDATWATVQQLAEKYPQVRGVDLQSNGGQYRATLCGLAEAEGAWIATMDDDLQHPPEELPRLLEYLETHPELDCVLASFTSKQHRVWRNLGSRVMAWLNVRLHGVPPGIQASGYRVLTRTLAKAMCEHGTVNPIMTPLLFRTTHRVANVPVQHDARVHGRSTYGVMRLVKIVLDNIFSATTLPLRLVSGLGLVAASGSFFLGCYYLGKYFLQRRTLAGFTTQVLLIIFFGGLTLFAVGLLGEYLGRVIEEVRRPPRYVVRARTKQGSGE